jgi:hypothetical protein
VTALGAAVLVPYVAAGEVLGLGRDAQNSLHPASWSVLVSAGCRLILAPQSLVDAWNRYRRPLLGLGLASALALLAQTMSDRPTGKLLIINQLVVPFLLVALVVAAGPGRRRQIELAVVALGVVEAILAVAHWAGWIGQPFESALAQQRWYLFMGSRQMGTTDHPLVLSFVLVAAVALVPAIRRPPVQFVALGVLLTGVLLTQSRTGILLAGVAVFAMLFNSHLSSARKVFLGAATVGATAYVLGSAVASGVLDRFSSDGGSADLRFRAYHDVAARIGEFLFIGGGTGNSFDVAASSGLVTSYENGPLMYAMDYGVPSWPPAVPDGGPRPGGPRRSAP